MLWRRMSVSGPCVLEANWHFCAGNQPPDTPNPSVSSGLRVGDRVLAINGTSTEGCTLAYCTRMLSFLVDPAGLLEMDIF